MASLAALKIGPSLRFIAQAATHPSCTWLRTTKLRYRFQPPCRSNRVLCQMPGVGRPTPPWRPWRRATSPARSRSLRIFRTRTRVGLEAFRDLLRSRPLVTCVSEETHDVDCTRLTTVRDHDANHGSCIFEAVKLGRYVRSPRSPSTAVVSSAPVSCAAA